MLDQSLLLLSQTILISVPFVLAALGGTCSERSGVVNIALEGILLAGAFGAAVGAFLTKSAWIGLAAGVTAGILVSSLHALIAVAFKIDQIISGLAINLLVAGGTEYGMHLVWKGAASRSIPVLPKWTVLSTSRWSDLANTVLGLPLVAATVLLVPLVWLLIARTRFGLRLRAVGENPAACDTLGISVPRMRTAGVLLSGSLAGLGGVWLAFNIGQFQHGMSAGKGFIAMAAVVCGKWNPLGAAAACLLFGFSGAFAAAWERWNPVLSQGSLLIVLAVLGAAAVAALVGAAVYRNRNPRSAGRRVLLGLGVALAIGAGTLAWASRRTLEEGTAMRLYVPGELLSTLPYVLTMVAVAGLVGRARSPAALGIPYEK